MTHQELQLGFCRYDLLFLHVIFKAFSSSISCYVESSWSYFFQRFWQCAPWNATVGLMPIVAAKEITC